MEKKPAGTEKRPTTRYETPKIEDHGDLTELTAGAGGSRKTDVFGTVSTP